MTRARYFVGAVMALALGATLPAGDLSAADDPRRFAVIAFDFSDSSGEPDDLSEEHAARMAHFQRTLEADLDDRDELEAVTLPCMAADCTVSTMPADELLEESRQAGVDFLVFGSIHKISTLIGSGRLFVLDAHADELILQRAISFRGDTDEAFRRAASFAAREVTESITARTVPHGQQ